VTQLRRLAWLAVAAAILFGAAYFGSPLLAWRSLREVARTADEQQMARLVDFPAVRGGLKFQLKTLFAARIAADPRLRNNPYAAMGLQLLPRLIDQMVDAYVTPQAIAVMVAEARPPAKSREVIALNRPVKLDVHYAYVNRDLFRVTASGAEHPDLPLEFLLRRDGLFGWTLIRITLPEKALQ